MRTRKTSLIEGMWALHHLLVVGLAISVDEGGESIVMGCGHCTSSGGGSGDGDDEDEESIADRGDVGIAPSSGGGSGDGGRGGGDARQPKVLDEATRRMLFLQFQREEGCSVSFEEANHAAELQGVRRRRNVPKRTPSRSGRSLASAGHELSDPLPAASEDSSPFGDESTDSAADGCEDSDEDSGSEEYDVDKEAGIFQSDDRRRRWRALPMYLQQTIYLNEDTEIVRLRRAPIEECLREGEIFLERGNALFREKSVGQAVEMWGRVVALFK